MRSGVNLDHSAKSNAPYFLYSLFLLYSLYTKKANAKAKANANAINNTLSTINLLYLFGFRNFDRMKILVLIPARYASSRFPGKPLAIIKGKPMIQRVYEQSMKAYDDVCVAADDERIYNKVKEFGGRVVMTSTEHQSGTDRCLEALERFSAEAGVRYDAVINVQGDEPYIQPEQIRLVGELLAKDNADIATLVMRVDSVEEYNNSNSPKVVTDKEGYALYFSRSPIPFSRGAEVTDEVLKNGRFYRHVGMYGYRSCVLKEICTLPQSFLEKTEKLEQLRWLENGYRIKTAITEYQTHAVDTPEDLKYLNETDL